MFVCILCSRRVSVEDAPHRLMLLTVCLRCIDVAAAGGITITAESAHELMKQAILRGPVPQRVDDALAQHASGGRCCLCAFDVSADDTKFHGPSGQVVCVRCYEHQVGGEKPMDKHLREQIQAVLAGVEG